MVIGVKLPKNVSYIITQLEKNGYEGYAVGGCVRDTILSKTPDDWDITTSAKPSEVKKIFPKTIDTGIAHGTVTVLVQKEGYEVTTYRIDGEYEDNRHPKEVVFTPSLIEDLKRRDFTINAMAYNDKEGLVDQFGGLEDIKAGVIRCVGVPEERFMEDALRIMRAIRFSAQLGYKIDDNTKKAIRALCGNLEHISAERIHTELTKLLLSDHPDYLKDAYEMGITAVILPEFDQIMKQPQNNPHHCYSVGEHTLHSLKEVPSNKVLRYAMLFHDFGKAVTATTDEKEIDHFYGHGEQSVILARQIMNRLRFDNDTRDKVLKLVKYHDLKIKTDQIAVRKAISKIGEEIFPMLLQIFYADIMAQSDYKRKEKLDILDQLHSIYQQIIKNGDCVSLKTLAVNGKDLIEMGMKPGKEIGDKLLELLEVVLVNPEKNTKEMLLSLCK